MKLTRWTNCCDCGIGLDLMRDAYFRALDVDPNLVRCQLCFRIKFPPRNHNDTDFGNARTRRSIIEQEMKAFDDQLINILWQKVLRMSKHRDDIWVSRPIKTKLEWAKLKASGKLIDLQRTKRKRYSEGGREPPDLIA